MMPSKSPISTYTNAAYAVAAYATGFWPLYLLAAGSAYYHWHERTQFSKPDWIAMYLVFGLIISPDIYGFFIAGAASIVHTYTIRTKAFVMLGAMFTVAMLINFSWLALAIFAIAFCIRQFGQQHFRVYPNHWMYDVCHGTWHILTATAFGVWI